jgi:MoxR-like ATPase
MSLSTKQQLFIDAMVNEGIAVADSYSRADLNMIASTIGMKYAPAWIVQDSSRRAERGYFRVPEYTGGDDTMIIGTTVASHEQGVPKVESAPVMNAIMGLTGGERESLIPTRMPDFVAWGHFKTIESIISSRLFAPVFVTGMSGNGKTTMIEQVCAKAKRECFRVNITQETDEDDLIGGFRLIQGETVFSAGPVVEAMRNGAVLLLDEIDLGSSKIMCLQPVLEGKGVFIKKTGEWVTPAKGFTVVATANTKGKGDNDGRFIGTNVMNEAFLDRFDWTLEQEYATKAVEKRILIKKMEKFGHVDKDFAEYLVKWAEITRKAFSEGAVDEIITTRRLENICKAFSIFKDRKQSVDLALARFDEETQSAFLNLYEKVDDTISVDDEEEDEKPKQIRIGHDAGTVVNTDYAVNA